MTAPGFHFSADSPIDMLDSVIAVTGFLNRVTPIMHENNQFTMNENESHGLTLILIGIEHTVKVAVEQLKEKH